MSIFPPHSFEKTFAALPSRQQKQLEQQALTYIRALDKAIAQVLSPVAGKEQSRFYVADEVIPLYGVGNSPKEAMDDYRSALVEYYESLEEDQLELGASLQKQLEVLRGVFLILEGAP